MKKSSFNNNNIMNKKLQNGITLIALVISIIVMLILAGVSINAIVGDNGILTQAQVSTVASKFAGYKEQLELNAIDDDGVYASGETVKKYIPTMEAEDVEKFVIMKRELMYIENNSLEIDAAKKVGIQTADTGEEGSASAIEEVKAVISGVVDLGSGFNVPEDDFTATTNTNDSSKGLVGIRLYDKNSVNSENWNIVIEYNNSNEEVARYGSGYYWLKAGETYIIDGKSIKFENDFIVNYAEKQYTVLSGRAVNWNLNSTIAVSEGMVLNLDPMTFADGEWLVNAEDNNFQDFYVTDTRTGRKESTGIQKCGDIEYEESTKSLKINESYLSNTENANGFMQLMKTGVDFSNGFTFEFYGNSPIFETTNGSEITGDNLCGGIFSRYGNGGYMQCMRFGWHRGNVHCKFSGSTEHDYNRNQIGIEANKDFYMTYVLNVDSEEEIINAQMYIDGELKGEQKISYQGYLDGCQYWNIDEAPFQIGRTLWHNDDCWWYFFGKCYTTRLYTTSMTPEQVKENYNTTLKYRSSF